MYFIGNNVPRLLEISAEQVTSSQKRRKISLITVPIDKTELLDNLDTCIEMATVNGYRVKCFEDSGFKQI